MRRGLRSPLLAAQGDQRTYSGVREAVLALVGGKKHSKLLDHVRELTIYEPDPTLLRTLLQGSFEHQIESRNA